MPGSADGGADASFWRAWRDAAGPSRSPAVAGLVFRRRGPGHKPVTRRRGGVPRSGATARSARRLVIARDLRPRQAGGGNLMRAI